MEGAYVAKLDLDPSSFVPRWRQAPSLIFSTEELEEIATKCRYIRKSSKQVTPEDTDLNLDISFLHDLNDHRNEKANPLTEEIETLDKRPSHQFCFETIVENAPPDISSASPCTINNNRAALVSPVLNRPNIEQLSVDFNDKCHIQPAENSIVSIQPVSRQKEKVSKKQVSCNFTRRKSKRNTVKMQILHKEIMAVAEESRLNLYAVVKNIKDNRSKHESLASVKTFKNINRGVKRWSLLALLVRSGFLARKNKSNDILKIIKQRRKNERLKERRSIATPNHRHRRSASLPKLLNHGLEPRCSYPEVSLSHSLNSRTGLSHFGSNLWPDDKKNIYAELTRSRNNSLHLINPITKSLPAKFETARLELKRSDMPNIKSFVGHFSSSNKLTTLSPNQHLHSNNLAPGALPQNNHLPLKFQENKHTALNETMPNKKYASERLRTLLPIEKRV